MGVVSILVFDEARGSHQKFYCEVNALLASMRYFKQHLKGVRPAKDFEISVYCDIPIFAALLRHVKHSSGRGRDGGDGLSRANVLPMLIASNFLQMEELVADCVALIAREFAALLSESADLGALPDDLLQLLAKEVSERQLEEAWAASTATAAAPAQTGPGQAGALQADGARALTLVQKLYRMKVEHLLKLVKTTVFKCLRCSALFSAAHISLLQCPIVRRGVQSGLHEMDRSWRFRSYVQELRAADESWRAVFWAVWGIVTVLYCFQCERYFSVSQYACCTGPPSSGAPASLTLHQMLPNGGLGKLPAGMELDHDSVRTCLHHMTAQRELVCTDTVTAAILLSHHPPAAATRAHRGRVSETVRGHHTRASSVPRDSAREFTRGGGALPGAAAAAVARDWDDAQGGASASDCSSARPSDEDCESSGGGSECTERRLLAEPDLGRGACGSLLATIGGEGVSVEDLALGDRSSEAATRRALLVQEDDKRRMQALMLFLESLREERAPAKPKRVPRARPVRPVSAHPGPLIRARRSNSARPSSARRRDFCV